MLSCRRREAAAGTSVLKIRLLGELRLERAGAVLPLPPSKKTRALLAYLAITGRPHRRDTLCNLLWDVADDPRGALRWSLSKLRNLVNERGCERLSADRERVAFEARDCSVDVLALRAELQPGTAANAPTELLERWSRAFAGELLEGLDLPDFDAYQGFCVAEREQTRKLRAEILASLARRLEADAERALDYARVWAQVDPLDPAARVALLRLAMAAGRPTEAEQHFESGRRLFEELGGPQLGELRSAWRELKHVPRAERRGTPRAIATAPESAPLVRPSARPVSSPRPLLVGRERELAAFFALLDEVAEQRRARVVLLTGEPGIGKSRLLAELSSGARERRTLTFRGVAYEGETGRPYGPFIDALRALSTARPGRPQDEEIALLLPEFGRGGEGESGRDKLFASVQALFGARARAAPALLVLLDDVQWLDSASSELLHYVARQSRDLPVLFVLAARGEEQGDNVALERTLRSLRRDGLLADRALAPLGQAAVARLVTELGGTLPPDRVHEQSGGNPLFALELVRCSPQADDELPDTVADAVRERVARLGPESADVLRWGAVLGSSFGLARLEGVCALDSAVVLSALESLERRALVRLDDGVDSAHYRFAHDVVRRVVYADLSEPRRRLMHRRVASLLQTEPSLDEAVIAEIAHHATLGHDDDLAASACTSAAWRCQRMFANADARTLARRGLRHAARLAEPGRTRRLIELCEVLLKVEPAEQAADALRELEILAERALDLGLAEHARRAFRALGYQGWERGSWTSAQRHMVQAELASRGANDDAARVTAMAEAARCLTLLERELPNAEAVLLEAEARARELGLELLPVRDGIGMLHLHEGRFEQAAECFERARELARTARDHLHEYQALEHLFVLEFMRGDHARAAVVAEQLLELGEKMREGSEGPFARCACALASRARGGGMDNAALEAAIEELRLVDAKHRLAYALTQAALLDIEHGAPERARTRATEALAVAELLERPSETALSRLILWRAAALAGDAAGAARLLPALDEQACARAAAAVRQLCATWTAQPD